MSIKRLILMTTLAAAMLPAGVAFCQPNDYRMDPPFTDFTPFNETTPFVEPGYFDHDLQFFAPSEIDEFSGPPKPKTGFFGEYQRMYLANPRGRDDTQNFVGGDFGWGNRFVVGYMLDTGSGWTVEYQNSNNVLTDLDTIRALSVNAANEFVFENIVTDQTTIDHNFQSVEIDKVFRMDQWENGGYWEAFAGAKYSYIRDKLSAVSRQGAILPGEFITSEFDQNTQNHIISASLGARFSKRKGSWKLNGEFRMFGGVNFQSEFFRLDQTSQDILGNPLIFQQTATTSAEEFTFGGDVLLQAEYFVTRDISLTGGWLFEHYGTGVTTIRTDGGDHQTRTGFIFGLVINR